MNKTDTAKLFVGKIEKTFGTYRSGMRELVVRWAVGRDARRLGEIYAELARFYDQGWPPTLARILAIEREMTNRPPEFKSLPEPKLTREEEAEVTRILDHWKDRIKSTRGVDRDRKSQEDTHGKEEKRRQRTA